MELREKLYQAYREGQGVALSEEEVGALLDFMDAVMKESRACTDEDTRHKLENALKGVCE